MYPVALQLPELERKEVPKLTRKVLVCNILRNFSDTVGRSHFPRITDRKPRVLLGLSGSVASIKVIPLVQAISQFAEVTHLCSHLFTPQVRVMVTEHAKHFFNDSELKNLCTVFSDADEWSTWNKMNDPVLHIEVLDYLIYVVIHPS